MYNLLPTVYQPFTNHSDVERQKMSEFDDYYQAIKLDIEQWENEDMEQFTNELQMESEDMEQFTNELQNINKTELIKDIEQLISDLESRQRN